MPGRSLSVAKEATPRAAEELAPEAAGEAAEKSESSPEAIRQFTDAANFQNNQVFELAVESWQKFLKEF